MSTAGGDIPDAQSSTISDTATAVADRFGVVRSSKNMLRMVDYARGIAPTRFPVLIQGEEGTGRERFARGVHELSGRVGAFVRVDTNAISEDSFEAELFGVHGGKDGLVQAASGGTLLIHGIERLPKLLQVKLLRLLRDGEYVRHGGNVTEQVDVRVIATCAADLDDLVEQDRFNRSLLLELSTAFIRLPALREREEDMSVLFSDALDSAARELGITVPQVEPAVFQMLRSYSWPENIRELNKLVVAAMMHAKGRPLKSRHFAALQERIDKGAKAAPVAAAKDDGVLDEVRPLFVELHEFEHAYLERLLKKCNNNLSRAAVVAGITRTTVREKLRLHKLRDVGEGTDPGGAPAQRHRLRRP